MCDNKRPIRTSQRQSETEPLNCVTYRQNHCLQNHIFQRKISSSDAGTNWRQKNDKMTDNDYPGKNDAQEELPPEMEPQEEKQTSGEEKRASVPEEVLVAESPPLLDHNEETKEPPTGL